MQDEIDKLLFIYDKKIEDCDKVISHLSNKIRMARRGAGEPKWLEQDKKDRAIAQAERQCYVQAKSDIDCLIDYIPQE